MTIQRFRKGELAFYKGSTTKEIKKYVGEHPENKEYVEHFLDNYRYNYVKKIWKKNR